MVKSLVFWFLLFFGTAANAEHVVRQSCDRLILSGPTEYAPLSYTEKSKLMGVGFEVARKVAAEIGMETETVMAGNWARTLRRQTDGNIDILVSLYRTPEREKDMLFLGAYWQENTILLMHRDNPVQFDNWADLKAYTGATVIDDSRGEKLDQYLKTELNIVYVPLQANAMTMLKAKRVDYVVLGENSLFSQDFASGAPDLRVHPTPLDSHGVEMSISRKSPCLALAGQLTEALDRLTKDGTVRKIHERFFQPK